MTQSHRRIVPLAALLLALLALTACSGIGDGGRDSGAGDDTASYEGGGSTNADIAEPQEASRGTNRPPVQTRAVIKTGYVAVTSEDLEAVREELDTLLDAFGGTVDRERTYNDRDGDIESSSLELRVPVADFEATMDALKKLGKLEGSRSNAKDVTTEVIDVNERAQTIQNSLDRLQRLQKRSANLEDLIDFEDQITSRESELRSLQAQQAYLADQTSLSTISLYLSTPDQYVEPDALEDAGFVAGLKGGWEALSDAVVIGLTVLGAVLPFAIAFGLVGVPLLFLLRSQARRRRAAAPVPQE